MCVCQALDFVVFLVVVVFVILVVVIIFVVLVVFVVFVMFYRTLNLLDLRKNPFGIQTLEN